MKREKQTYGLFTTIAMIVGIVIGSGIYFKADDILSFTGGSLWLGVVVLLIGSTTIIFGSLSLSELAQRTTSSGGISSYFEDFVHPGLAAAIGLFTTFVYIPSITAIISWVASIYTWILLGKDVSFETQITLAVGYLLGFTVMNYFSRVLAGRFQVFSTVVKLIPLLTIAVVGLFWAQAQPEIPVGFEVVPVKSVGWGWLSALVPLAFSFDGWSVVVGIAPEIKDPNKNLVRAFFLGPLIILFTYLFFFIGMNQILGQSYIMSTGNEAIYHAVQLVFGKHIGNALLFILIISVLGGLNGMMLSGMRMPQAIAERNWVHQPSWAKIDLRYQLSPASTMVFTITTLIWLAAHYVITTYNWLPGSDISEVSIVFSSVTYVLLYVAVLKMYKKGEVKNILTGLVAPVIGILSAAMLVVGSFITTAHYLLFFFAFCFTICGIGYALYRNNNA